MCLLDQGIDNFKTDLSTLHPILTECRVIKSKLELDILQYANDISSEAHVEVIFIRNVTCSISGSFLAFFTIMYSLGGIMML